MSCGFVFAVARWIWSVATKTMLKNWIKNISHFSRRPHMFVDLEQAACCSHRLVYPSNSRSQSSSSNLTPTRITNSRWQNVKQACQNSRTPLPTANLSCDEGERSNKRYEEDELRGSPTNNTLDLRIVAFSSSGNLETFHLRPSVKVCHRVFRFVVVLTWPQ